MAEEKKENKGEENKGGRRTIVSFLKEKNITTDPRKFVFDALGAMAFGLFASLLIGTIFSTLGSKLEIDFFNQMATYATQATGAAIGLAIAYTLKSPPLVLYTCAAVGIAGYTLGGPVGAYVAVIIACELGKFISKETKIDIILTPAVTLAAGTGIAIWAGPWLDKLMTGCGELISRATDHRPLIMGALVAMLVGIALTLPISSAAICAALAISGLAGGAATAGCCAQMVGFAIMSFADNGWGGFLAQGLGTSMLQMPNIVKKPTVWLPPIMASAVTGALSTTVFKLENTGVAAGMGTCGLVGPIGVITTMSGDVDMWVGIILICAVLPALLTWTFAWPLRKLGWINPGDLKLEDGLK